MTIFTQKRLSDDLVNLPIIHSFPCTASAVSHNNLIVIKLCCNISLQTFFHGFQSTFFTDIRVNFVCTHFPIHLNNLSLVIFETIN